MGWFSLWIRMQYICTMATLKEDVLEACHAPETASSERTVTQDILVTFILGVRVLHKKDTPLLTMYFYCYCIILKCRTRILALNSRIPGISSLQRLHVSQLCSLTLLCFKTVWIEQS